MVSICNIYSLWSFTHWFNSKNTWFAKRLHKHWFSSIKFFGRWAYNTSLYSQYFKHFPKKLQKQFILHCPKSFIQFLSECLVNLLRGKLKGFRKVDVLKYRRELSGFTRRRTSLHKRRTISSSPKRLPINIQRLTKYGSVCSNSLLNLSITKYTSKKTKIRTKVRKRGGSTKRIWLYIQWCKCQVENEYQ